LPHQPAERLDKGEQFGPKDEAFAHVDDAVARLGIEAEQDLAPAPLGAERGPPAG
jgi:hypothetical protein